MKTYFRILAFSRPYRNYLPFLFISILLSVIFETLNVSFIAPILNVLFKESTEVLVIKAPEFTLSIEYFESLMSYAKYRMISFGTKKEVLMLISLALLTSVFFANLFVFTSRFILAFVKAKMVRKMRIDIFSKINRLHLSYFSNKNRGDLISRMTNDIQEVESSALATIHAVLKEPFKVIFTFIILYQINSELMIFSLIVLPISSVIIGVITKMLRKKAKQGQEQLGKILGTIDETLEGMKVITSFNAQPFMLKKFFNQNRKYERAFRSMDYKRGSASPVSQILGVAVFTVILYYGGGLVIDKELDAGTFFVFIMLFANVISPLKSISSVVSNIQRGLICGNRIFSILDMEEEIKDKENATLLNAFDNTITFKNVDFKYQEQLVLQGINLEIKKGETVALVGPSGAGKTTIADLIPRFYDIQKGEVLIDDHNIKDYTLTSLREQIGVVTQESILFNDTIYNNITFGNTDATEEQVIEAAKIANAHEFIIKTENGYKTEIGDRGTRLSGGQKQRISIARAVLKNPPIMILDEATSALDTESEKLVQNALNNLMKNRTSIVIAHRLSTIQNADKIVVLQDGKIVEVGTHKILMDNGSGLYRKLMEMQGA